MTIPMIPVLDKGEVRLISHNASDLSVVAAARVSTGLGPEEASKGEDKDAKLIRYLLRHNHGTPFEHNQLVFYVKAPIFVVREWHRHRAGWSYNEVSGRYTELPGEFYVPKRVRVPHETNKQGAVESDAYALNMFALQEIDANARCAFNIYREMLEKGVAREMARIVLPLNTYTSFYATCNARSLMHFLNLRLAEDAQFEIRQYADAMRQLWSSVMPVTHDVWEELR